MYAAATDNNCTRPPCPDTQSTSFMRASSILTLLCILSYIPAIGIAAIRVEAYRGEPFGIGKATFDLAPGATTAPWDDDRFTIADDEGRILYPVVGNQPVRKFVRQFLGIGAPWRAEFYFMFRGDEPIEATLYVPDAHTVRITPIANAGAFRELLDDWWKAVESRYEQVYREAEYPIVVENYLTANWARRLRRDMPEPTMYLLRRQKAGGTWLAQLAASEAYQALIEREIVLGQVDTGGDAMIPLPEPVRTPPLILPIPPSNVEIEPLANHVPQECFYLRFGSFPNYLWFRDFIRHWQGDLGNMLVRRNIDRQSSERLQQQLGIGETKLSRILGPTVIRDVAIIGFDAYLRDGASMGILFHAKNGMLLGHNLSSQRKESMQQIAGATDDTITIAGHDVSYISAPKGQLRSYYAVDGDFHLVTTSRRLVERFFTAGAGEGSLASAADFQLARAEFPTSRNDTVFLYASPAFFENLASPRYRIELDRRVRSIGEMRLLKLARLAARAEGLEADSIDELSDAELLPEEFGLRADGSKLIESDAGFRDSVRGLPGWMAPIADIDVGSVTRAEVQRYSQLKETIEREVGRFVPLAVAIQREVSQESSIDHITAEVRLAPYSQTKLAPWANMLGPSQALRVAPIDGDIVSGQVVWGGLGEPVHLFGGLRDSQPPLIVREGQARPQGPLWDAVRGYIGAWPRPHLFDRFFGQPTTPFDSDGIARNDGLFRFWQRRLDDFFLFSFKRDVLMEVGPQLAMIESDRPAQFRLHIDDLSDKKIETTISGLGYAHARATSASATRFMNSIATQLHVSAQDARLLAEQLVGGRFDCPLGGDYTLIEESSGRALWASTAAAPNNQFLLTTIPADYHMPLVEWLRGLEIEGARLDDALVLRAKLAMVHLEIEPPADENGGGLTLPNLGSFLSGLGIPDDQDQESLPPPADESD